MLLKSATQDEERRALYFYVEGGTSRCEETASVTADMCCYGLVQSYTVHHIQQAATMDLASVRIDLGPRTIKCAS